MEKVGLGFSLLPMKTRRLYLTLFTLFALYWTLMNGVQIVYMGLAEMFGEGGFNDHITARVVRDLFLYSGLAVCFGWEALRAHWELRQSRGRRTGAGFRRVGGLGAILLGLSGFAWATAFGFATRRTFTVLGPWAGLPDALFLILGLGGSFYFLSIGLGAIRAKVEKL